MRLPIFTKLFVSIFLVSSLMLGSMSVMINSSFRVGLQDMVNEDEMGKVEQIVEDVKSYYSQSYGWQKLIDSPYLWAAVLRQFGEQPPRPPGPENQDRARDILTVDVEKLQMAPLGQRLNLLDTKGQVVVGDRRNLSSTFQNMDLSRIEIIIDEQTVGWVSVLQSRSLSGRLADNFYRQQSQHMLAIALLTIFCSLVIAFFLVRHFLKPLRALHQATQAIESGQFDYQIKEQGNDEFTELTRVFNRLVLSLKKQKIDRENWLSDISHELRTPLAVLKGEIEAIQDGIRPASPDYINALHRQVLNLEKLVNDLHQLSLNDSATNISMQSLSLTSLTEIVISEHQHRFHESNLKLKLNSVNSNAIEIQADEKSCRQLLNNLLENSLRYTDNGGEVLVSLNQDEAQTTMTIDDSYPGVSDTNLPKLFKRLYRVDESRNRASGGSGLGLSICESIVKAHGGTIDAQHSPLGGLRVLVTIPTIAKSDNV